MVNMETGKGTFVYIGLGSNLDDPVEQVKKGLHALQDMPETSCIMCSSLYRSEPLGPSGQPAYINAVAMLETELTADELLSHMQRIENRHGRVRNNERWGPRTLDLDLLLYGEEEISSIDLTVPHPGLYEREFVLYPLYEVAPHLKIPGVGSFKDLVEKCPRRGLQCLEKVRNF